MKTLAEVIASYQKGLTWTKGPTMFTIPAIDYLVVRGVVRQDAEGNECEIIDQLNCEILEGNYSTLVGG